MSEESLAWDDVEDYELVRAILQLLESGDLILPVCPRCLRLLDPERLESFAEGGGQPETSW